MEDWFVELEKLKEKPEIEFLGIAIDIRFPCNCRYCEEGKRKLEEGGQTPRGKQLHIVIAPLSNYVKLQHAFIDMSRNSKISRKGIWVHAMTVNRIPFKNRKEFEKFLKSNVILYKKTTVGEYCKDYMKIDERIIQQLGRVANAQVLYPAQVIPKDALELYDLDLETIKKRVKIYREAWKKLLNGENEDKVYQWVQEQLAEFFEETFEEEDKEVKTNKSKKSKKSKKEEEEEIEVEEEGEEEVEEEEIEEEEEEEEILI